MHEMKRYALERTFIDFPTCTTIRICIRFRRSLQYCLHMHARLWNTLSNSLALKVSMTNVKTEYLVNTIFNARIAIQVNGCWIIPSQEKNIFTLLKYRHMKYLMNSAIFKYLDLCAIFWIFNSVLSPVHFFSVHPVYSHSKSLDTRTHTRMGDPLVKCIHSRRSCET